MREHDEQGGCQAGELCMDGLIGGAIPRGCYRSCEDAGCTVAETRCRAFGRTEDMGNYEGVVTRSICVPEEFLRP